MKIDIVNKSLFDLPKFAIKGDVGMDLYANITDEWLDLQNISDNNISYISLNNKHNVAVDFYKKSIWLEPRDRVLIPTGIHIGLPTGYEAQIRSRSGLALKYGVCVLNSPGTIDNEYTGEIQIIIYNSSNQRYEVQYGDKIAQMVIKKYEDNIEWDLKSTLTSSIRDTNGFGHTGDK